MSFLFWIFILKDIYYIFNTSIFGCTVHLRVVFTFRVGRLSQLQTTSFNHWGDTLKFTLMENDTLNLLWFHMNKTFFRDYSNLNKAKKAWVYQFLDHRAISRYQFDGLVTILWVLGYPNDANRLICLPLGQIQAMNKFATILHF